MQKGTVLGILVVLTCVILTSCAPLPYVKTGWDYYPPDRTYIVTGRVLNFTHNPVNECKVIIIKRKWAGDVRYEEERPIEIVDYDYGKLATMAEYMVAATGRDGEYSFVFEPWKSYDVWLYFDAREQGYEAQAVQLNSYIRDMMARGSGRSPLRVNITLEPLQHPEDMQYISAR